MASNDLIDGYVADLARRLPPDVVDELTDGVVETFHQHRARGLDPSAAAVAATADFGEPDQIGAAFARQAPGRRAAVALLATGPIFGALWGSSLITAKAWTWPIPAAAAIAFGTTLLIIVASLVAAATSRSYARTRLASVGCSGLILLDLAMLAVIAVTSPTLVWPMALAIPASLVRVGISARSLPRLLTR